MAEACPVKVQHLIRCSLNTGFTVLQGQTGVNAVAFCRDDELHSLIRGTERYLKNAGLGKFRPALKMLEALVIGLEVSFSGDFCVSQSRSFLPTGLRVSDMWFFLSVWSQESGFTEFMGTA